MAYRYNYALEKFSRAVESLATGGDEIQRRLLPIFQGDLLMITPEDLPPKLQEDYKWIKKQVTKYDEKYPGQRKRFESVDGRYDHLMPTKLEATLSRIRRATGVKVARKLFHIWSVLDEDSRAGRC
jgi:Ni2+-binding GTPase involved in maturation of urease and hydrogenase